MAILHTAPLGAPGAETAAAPRNGLLRETAVLTRRLLVRSIRTPMTLVHAILLPVAFLLTLKVVFGNTITSMTGEDSLYRSVPLVALVAAMSGSTTGMVGINSERLDGFLGRLWSLPIHRAAGMLSRVVAETIRLIITTLVLLVTGLILGFRFHSGVGSALVWLAIPVIFGVAFAAVATVVALYSPRAVMVEAMQPVIILGANFCTGFVPVEMYPDWVQPAVRHQPMSSAVDAMRGLSVGGPVLEPLVNTLLWCAAILAVCLPLIVAGYRRASTNR